ncbi:MAG: ribosome biogenesis GTPase Der [Pseudomonadota bacterium]
MVPVVALVGRPNVGKSTLFNVLTRSRDALVADFEGLTRDRRYGIAETVSGNFVLVDTGGLTGATEGIDALTEGQVQAAVEESSLVLFVVDGRAGLVAEDERIAARLRTAGKPVMIIVNKTDGLDEAVAVADFYTLGFEEVLPVAAAHRRGTTQLGEIVAEAAGVEPTPEDGEQERRIRLTVIGRPNVGKSTLVNRLLGEERVVAFDAPGTTRDAIEIPWVYEGRDFTLVDTAGVRRRSRVDESVEKFSVIKALRAIEESDVIIVTIDAQEGIVEQDATLLGLVLKAARPLVIAINKWDHLPTEQRDTVRRELDRRLTFVPYAEQVFISALHGSGLGEMMDAVEAAYDASHQQLSTKRLTEILQGAYDAHQPPMVHGRTAKLRYAHLGGNVPLRIVIHGTRVHTIPDSYRRYLAGVFRKRLQLVGTPILLDLRQSENPFKGRRNQLSGRQLAKRKRLKRFVNRKR